MLKRGISVELLVALVYQAGNRRNQLRFCGLTPEGIYSYLSRRVLVSQRVTQRITRMWGHRRKIPVRDNPGQTEDVHIMEVRITEMNLAYLKEAVRVAEERLATLKNHFGQEAIANLDRPGHERTNVLNNEQQKSLSYALPKLQLWPGNRDSEKDLRVYAEAIQLSYPPVQGSYVNPNGGIDIAAPVEEAENLPNDDDDDDDGEFFGLGDLFGNRGQGR